MNPLTCNCSGGLLNTLDFSPELLVVYGLQLELCRALDPARESLHLSLFGLLNAW